MAPDAPSAALLWDVSKAWDLPVWLHHDLRGVEDARALDRALARHPDGPRVVLCHAGMPHGGGGDWRLCAKLLGRNPRLMAELSWSAREAASADARGFWRSRRPTRTG